MINAHKSVTINSDLPILGRWGGGFLRTMKSMLFFNLILSDMLIITAEIINGIFWIGKIYPMPNFEIYPVFNSIPEVV